MRRLVGFDFSSARSLRCSHPSRACPFFLLAWLTSCCMIFSSCCHLGAHLGALLGLHLWIIHARILVFRRAHVATPLTVATAISLVFTGTYAIGLVLKVYGCRGKLVSAGTLTTRPS